MPKLRQIKNLLFCEILLDKAPSVGYNIVVKHTGGKENGETGSKKRV